MTTICERKIRYSLRGLAEQAARRQRATSGEVIHAYDCSECGGFHIGHPSLKVPRAVRRQARRKK